MRLELGGYFPSLKSLEVNLFVQFSNLNDRWMRKPMPRIRANLYRFSPVGLNNFTFGLERSSLPFSKTLTELKSLPLTLSKIEKTKVKFNPSENPFRSSKTFSENLIDSLTLS